MYEYKCCSALQVVVCYITSLILLPHAFVDLLHKNAFSTFFRIAKPPILRTFFSVYTCFGTTISHMWNTRLEFKLAIFLSFSFHFDNFLFVFWAFVYRCDCLNFRFWFAYLFGLFFCSTLTVSSISAQINWLFESIAPILVTLPFDFRTFRASITISSKIYTYMYGWM